MCRLGAIKLSFLQPTMRANGVNMVAVGMELTGAEEFMDAKFFDGGIMAKYHCGYYPAGS